MNRSTQYKVTGLFSLRPLNNRSWQFKTRRRQHYYPAHSCTTNECIVFNNNVLPNPVLQRRPSFSLRYLLFLAEATTATKRTNKKRMKYMVATDTRYQLSQSYVLYRIFLNNILREKNRHSVINNHGQGERAICTDSLGVCHTCVVGYITSWLGATAVDHLMSCLASNNSVLAIEVELIEQVWFCICRVTIWIDTSSEHSLLQTTTLQTIGTWFADTCEWNPEVRLLQWILLLQETEHLLSLTLEFWIGLECGIPVWAIGGLLWVVLLVWLRAGKDSCPAFRIVAVSRSCSKSIKWIKLDVYVFLNGIRDVYAVVGSTPQLPLCRLVQNAGNDNLPPIRIFSHRVLLIDKKTTYFRIQSCRVYPTSQF